MENGEPEVNEDSVASAKKLIFSKVAFVLLVLVIGGIMFVTIILPLLKKDKNTRHANCGNQLKQIGLSLKMYDNEHNDTFPPLSEEIGRLMFNHEDIYPDYMSSPSVFICPYNDSVEKGDPIEDLIDDHSYYYISHKIKTEEEGLAYVEAYRAAAKAGEGFDHDFITPGGIVIRRISSEFERFGYTTKPEFAGPNGNLRYVLSLQRQIPVMIEKPDNHTPAGGNVLFLDGHVEFMKLDSGFPMTTIFIEALQSIDK